MLCFSCIANSIVMAAQQIALTNEIDSKPQLRLKRVINIYANTTERNSRLWTYMHTV